MAAPEALAFDVYGTLVDPIGVRKELERYLLDEAPQVAEVWRQKQLEYTFLLTAMERYEDFEEVTRKALNYALAAAGEELDQKQKDAHITRDVTTILSIGSFVRFSSCPYSPDCRELRDSRKLRA